jgi:hypothetical protein
MSYTLKPLEFSDLDFTVETALKIYDNSDPDKYPEFKITNDIDRATRFQKFFRMFLIPSEFNNHNIRKAFGLFKDDECICLVGVRRWGHLPSWSISWLLSPSIGPRFIPIFRILVQELCDFHEKAGMNEFYVTYPSTREAAYSKIMLPIRERYFTFVECVVPKNERHPYGFIHELMGGTLHPHEMSFRRYILRRDNTDAPSAGGKHVSMAAAESDLNARLEKFQERQEKIREYKEQKEKEKLENENANNEAS